ncbi:MAG TPA: FtsX-like permease family protein [Ghiorsea sp.]|nr:FtsX-like permease family protein [Ghiorsea sp.]HIP07477.1 FtsX-like permease family protein [Mariprofundaceae bacterium]
MKKSSRAPSKKFTEHKSSMRLPGGWQLPPFGVHQVLALAIVAVALWSVAIIWLALQGGEQWVGSWQDEIKVHVYVDKNQQESLASLQANLRDIDGIEDVRLVSDGETQAWMEKWLGGEDLDAASFSKHLPASVEVTLQEPRGVTVLDEIRDVAAAQSAEINEDELQLVEAGDVLGSIQSLAWFATIILAMAMALIVSNTLRMILLARAEEVHLMRLMGAKEWFVRLPFVLEGLLLGAGAGFAAWILMWPLIWFTADWQSNLSVDLSGWVLLLPLIFGGAVVGALGALIATANIVAPETDS